MLKSQFLPSQLFNVVVNCLQRNAYFAHSEMIILNLLCDPSLEIRRQGLEIYKVAVENTNGLRKYILPKLNKNTTTMLELLDSFSIWSPPPLLLRTQPEILEASVLSNTVCDFFKGIPCHSQAVERHVSILAKVAKVVCGEDKRDAMVKNILASQALNPSCTRKKYFSVE